MTGIPLGKGAEFDRIRAIAAALGPDAKGLGNDCAVLPPGFGEVVLSTDLSVEGVHFRREWLTWEEIGWRVGLGRALRSRRRRRGGRRAHRQRRDARARLPRSSWCS